VGLAQKLLISTSEKWEGEIHRIQKNVAFKLWTPQTVYSSTDRR